MGNPTTQVSDAEIVNRFRRMYDNYAEKKGRSGQEVDDFDTFINSFDEDSEHVKRATFSFFSRMGAKRSHCRRPRNYERIQRLGRSNRLGSSFEFHFDRPNSAGHHSNSINNNVSNNIVYSSFLTDDNDRTESWDVDSPLTRLRDSNSFRPEDEAEEVDTNATSNPTNMYRHFLYNYTNRFGNLLDDNVEDNNNDNDNNNNNNNNNNDTNNNNYHNDGNNNNPDDNNAADRLSSAILSNLSLSAESDLYSLRSPNNIF